MSVRVAVATACLLAVSVAGCGVIYTSPDVRDGSVFGDAPDTDFQVQVVELTYETAAAANLAPFVAQRLPLAFQPGAAEASLAAGPAPGAAPLVPLPAPTSPPLSRPGFLADRLPPPVQPEPYRIGVSDVLLLSVSTPATLENLPALIEATAKRQGYVVQDDGMIAIPDVGRVRVGGLTVREAEDQVFEAVAAAGIDPNFTIEIAEFHSKSVAVGGLVNSPILVPITLRPLFLHEALQIAGGIAPVDPETALIQIFRNGERYQVSVDRYLREPGLKSIMLTEGDTVFVVSEYREDQAAERFQQLLDLRTQQIATTRFEFDVLQEERDAFLDRVELGAVPRQYAYVAGEVVTPRRFPLPFESRANLTDVLLDERGLNIQFADYEEIYVLRGALAPQEFGGVTAYHLDAGNAVNLVAATTFLMQPNDIVFVAEQPVTTWNRVVSQILPNLFLSAARFANVGGN